MCRREAGIPEIKEVVQGEKMERLIVFAVTASLLSGCGILTKRAKRDVLQNADKELTSILEDREKDCDLLLSRLRTLKQKVVQELEKVK